MPLRAEYTLHQSGFNNFLHATIWEDRNGISLSVLSALARLDIDPWAESARLAGLPRGAATAALAAILSRLPRNTRGTSDNAMIADHLVGLLPTGGSVASESEQGGGDRDTAGGSKLWLVVALFAAIGGLVANGWLS